MGFASVRKHNAYIYIYLILYRAAWPLGRKELTGQLGIAPTFTNIILSLLVPREYRMVQTLEQMQPILSRRGSALINRCK